MNMKGILSKLSEEEKNKVADLLAKVDNILEGHCEDEEEHDDYSDTEFYSGMYEIMSELGRWC